MWTRDRGINKACVPCIVVAGVAAMLSLKLGSFGATTAVSVLGGYPVPSVTGRPQDGPESGYHGNFTATLFERCFASLCSTIKDELRLCRIHMDGAAYHKRRFNPVPKGSSNKNEIMEWLHVNLVLIGENLKKSQLLQLGLFSVLVLSTPL